MKKEFKVEDKEYFVKSPSPKVLQEAKRRYSAEFFKCLDDGIPTKEEAIKRLTKVGVWTEKDSEKEKDLVDKINELEFELYKGGENTKRVTLTEGKSKALEIKKLRSEYMSLISERQSYESNTAEAISDNVRFDFLVSECTYNADNTKVYNSYEDYQEKAEEQVAYEAASILAQVMYNLEDDFIKKLPENQFLSMFDLVDDEMRLVNKEGHLIDSEGRLINELGHYVDSEGQRVDVKGNRLTEEGLFELDAVYIDDEGNEIILNKEPKKENVETEKTETSTIVEVLNKEEESNG